jgi:tRNA dimethylallyltransferase
MFAGFSTNPSNKMNKQVIIVAGPTAVGKTALAIELAQQFQTKIISADSRQCFQELNIGVAKPSAAELQQVQHFFINSHSVEEQVNAAVFEHYALQTAEELFQQHNTIIMVGGTGLYIKAFCEGMDFIPAIDENIRKQLQSEYEVNGLLWLEQQLILKDPLFAQQGEMQNPQRMLRALEVVTGSGQSILTFKTGTQKKRNFNIIHIGLDLPPEELYRRINCRVDDMISAGLIEEAKQLYTLQHLNALQTVGYAELFSYFEGKISLEKAIDKIKQNTRHYAKRQLTWFRRNQDIQWFSPADGNKILAYCQGNGSK